MQTLGEILVSEKKTTHTKTLCDPVNEAEPFSLVRTLALSANVDFTQPPKVCEICGEPTHKDRDCGGILRRLPSPCRCRRELNEEIRRRDAALAEGEFMRFLGRFRSYSLMDERFERSTFENWVHTDDNKRLYELGKKYCENWGKVCAGNYGLLLYGNAGSGKSYLSFAIANELHKQKKSAMAISVSALLTLIKESFDRQDVIGEAQVMRAVSDVSLLILDDFGIEYRTGWAYEELYAIIDRRYRSAKPLIITTNLSIEELRGNLMLMKGKTGQKDESERIFDRIAEMCQFEEIKGKDLCKINLHFFVLKN